MANEINSAQLNSTNIPQKKSSLLKDTATSLGMSAVMTGGFGGVSCVKRNGGISKAIEATQKSNEAFKDFENVLNSYEMDTFTKNHIIAKNYEEYSRASKDLAKLEKLKEQQSAGKFDFLGRRAKKIGQLEEQESNLNQTIKDIKSGTAANKYKGTTLKSDIKGLFKEELINPLNLFFVASSMFSRITSEVVPTFKEQGFKAGIKKLGSCALKTVVDTVSNAGFSAVFRVLGSTALSFLGPVGRALGGTLGDMVGSVISNKIITKVFKEDQTNTSSNQAVTDETASSNETYPMQEQEANPQVAQVYPNTTDTASSTNPIATSNSQLPEQAKSISQRRTTSTRTATRGYSKPQGDLNFYNPQSLSFINSKNSNRLKTNYLA